MEKQNSSKKKKNEIKKLVKGESYLSEKLLDQLVKSTNIDKEIIEESNSELFFHTLNGIGKLTFENNLSYLGKVKYGIFESGNDKSEISFTDGTKYEGEVHDNQLTGQGIYYFPSGSIYTGQVLNGLRNGYGVYTSTDGIKYEGNWKDGLKNGFGVLTKENSKYEGEWKDGYMNGYGKIYWNSGNEYKGEL